MSACVAQPRFIRVKAAPSYCGMDARTFEAKIRPKLTEIPVSIQGKAFDRIEMDEVLDEYKEEYGRAPEEVQEQKRCKNEEPQALSASTGSGISTKQSTVSDFAKAAKRAKSKKQKSN